MAITQALIRQSPLLRSKQQRDIARPEPLPDRRPRFRQTPQRLTHLAISHCCRSHNQRTVRNRLRHSGTLVRMRQQLRRAYRRLRFPPRLFIGIHHAQLQRPEIAHCPCHGANIQRIAHRHQHHAQIVHPGFHAPHSTSSLPQTPRPCLLLGAAALLTLNLFSEVPVFALPPSNERVAHARLPVRGYPTRRSCVRVPLYSIFRCFRSDPRPSVAVYRHSPQRFGPRWRKRHAPEILPTFHKLERNTPGALLAAPHRYHLALRLLPVVLVHQLKSLCGRQCPVFHQHATVRTHAHGVGPVSEFLPLGFLTVRQHVHAHDRSPRAASLDASIM